jgi:hypothetical protein
VRLEDGLKKISLGAFLLLALTGGRAEAQYVFQDVVSRQYPTAEAVLKHNFCNPLWASKALEDSGIPLERAAKLKAGESIRLSAPDCDERPPADVVTASLRLASAQRRASPRKVTPPPAPVVVTKVVEVPAKITLDDKIKVENNLVKQVAQPQPSKGMEMTLVLSNSLFALGGVIVGALGWALLTRQKPRTGAERLKKTV